MDILMSKVHCISKILWSKIGLYDPDIPSVHDPHNSLSGHSSIDPPCTLDISQVLDSAQSL